VVTINSRLYERTARCAARRSVERQDAQRRDDAAGIPVLLRQPTGRHHRWQSRAGLPPADVVALETQLFPDAPNHPHFPSAYRLSAERRTAGGLLSLDGPRPTAISAGVVAHEMLKILHDLARVKC
jgi:hypothetical protein